MKDKDISKEDDVVDVFSIAIEEHIAVGQAMAPTRYYGSLEIAQMELNFTIKCADGFYGPNCTVPCHVGTPCSDCLPGYTGQYCHIDIDYCVGVDCGNGECIDQIESFVCACHEGYIGELCDRVDHCYEDPCIHGNCSILEDGFECSCAPGFIGPNCNETDHCATNNCTENQICLNTKDSFLCQCKSGDEVCTGEVDSCSEVVCAEHQVCEEESLACVCEEGLQGVNCTVSILGPSK